jgi:nucleoside-diphosphate-sugar epimerase
MMEVLILGCGFTGRRVARRLLQQRRSVTVTSRHPRQLADLATAGARVLHFEAADPSSRADLVRDLPENLAVLYSIPLVEAGGALDDCTSEVLQSLGGRPARVVYLSTTGVYGAAFLVTGTTQVAPRTPRESLRVLAEKAVTDGPWSSLILRPAAIYGPGRGVHAAMRRGTFRFLGSGGNFISRIHVEDLATHAGKALFSEITGAYPVADDEPCTSREIAQFCADLLGLPMPASAAESDLPGSRRADRRVDGSAIRRLLGVTLQYPSYRTGIPAALAEEESEACNDPASGHTS